MCLHAALTESVVADDQTLCFVFQVRIRAQRALSEGLDTYLFASRMILPDILPLLESNDQVTHDQFKVSVTFSRQKFPVDIRMYHTCSQFHRL